MADENDFPERGPNHTMITLPFDNSDGELPYVTKGGRDSRFVSPLSALSFEANLSLPKLLWMLDRNSTCTDCAFAVSSLLSHRFDEALPQGVLDYPHILHVILGHL